MAAADAGNEVGDLRCPLCDKPVPEDSVWFAEQKLYCSEVCARKGAYQSGYAPRVVDSRRFGW